ncbi:MAG TPA: DUF72 domain-containing protein [Kofleriaceae bacterium]|jgi:uncharacterized protein YecE (DUF72 family)
MLRGYYLGCPGWGLKQWVGRLFPEGTRNTEFLARYAEVFNTVEGNTTFYALPTPEIVARWNEQTPREFRFCFKFPRTVSHDKSLVDCAAEVNEFLGRISPLADKLGTLMLQLPPRFVDLDRLSSFLDALPRDFHYAVEYRHEAFFSPGPAEDASLELLRDRGVDLVIMDTRGIHSSRSLQFADVRARKPNVPVVMRATSSAPIVRCVPHEEFHQSLPFVMQWPAQIARWITDGKRPFFFMHSPDDIDAPANAYQFHAMLSEHASVGELPHWPGAPRQQSLF